jgi:hypothetical protein
LATLLGHVDSVLAGQDGPALLSFSILIDVVKMSVSGPPELISKLADMPVNRDARMFSLRLEGYRRAAGVPAPYPCDTSAASFGSDRMNDAVAAIGRPRMRSRTSQACSGG